MIPSFVAACSPALRYASCRPRPCAIRLLRSSTNQGRRDKPAATARSQFRVSQSACGKGTCRNTRGTRPCSAPPGASARRACAPQLRGPRSGEARGAGAQTVSVQHTARTEQRAALPSGSCTAVAIRQRDIHALHTIVKYSSSQECSIYRPSHPRLTLSPSHAEQQRILGCCRDHYTPSHMPALLLLPAEGGPPGPCPSQAAVLHPVRCFSCDELKKSANLLGCAICTSRKC
jgi:hypothetical protein